MKINKKLIMNFLLIFEKLLQMKNTFKTIVMSVFFLIITSNCILSKEITLESARQVAKNVYFERSFINKNPDSVKIYEETLININEKPMYYIFNIASNKGFVIVAADDRVFPVLAYSFFGNFNLDNQPPSVIEK
jgi:hypothetical protein